MTAAERGELSSRKLNRSNRLLGFISINYLGIVFTVASLARFGPALEFPNRSKHQRPVRIGSLGFIGALAAVVLFVEFRNLSARVHTPTIVLPLAIWDEGFTGSFVGLSRPD